VLPYLVIETNKRTSTYFRFAVNCERVAALLSGNGLRRERGSIQQVNFICSSRIHPQKNLLRLVRSFGEAIYRTRRDIKLTMVGKAHRKGYLEKIRRLINKLDLTESVVILEQVSFPELIKLYARSDVLIDPAFYGTFDVVVLEAMVCGLPIIVSNRVGASESVEEERCGLVVDPDDSESMVMAIVRLAESYDLRNELGNVGYRAANDKYNYHSMIEDIKTVYHDLI